MSLTRVIEEVLAQWDEPGCEPCAILPAEHELATYIESAVLDHLRNLSEGQRSDLILGITKERA